MAMFGGDTSMTIVIRAKNEAEKVFKKIEKNTKGFKDKVNKMQPAFKRMAVVGTAAFAAVSVGVGKAINTARDFEEETNKFDVVFQDVAAEAEAMANTLNKSYRLSRLEAKKLLSSTGDILTGFGFTGKAALDLSSNVNTLAVDLASFTNAQGGAAAVSDALTKALLGERESLKTYGIAIQEADVQAELLAQGMDGLTGEALRQAKAQVTLDIAMRQSRNAIGDTARSVGSLKATQDQLHASTEDLAIEVGKIFAPILNDITQKILPLVDALREWTEENPKLAKTIIIVTAALTAFLAVVGFIGLALVPLTTGFTALISVVSGLGLALAGLSIQGAILTGGLILLIPLIVIMIVEWEKTSIIIGVLMSHFKAFGKLMAATGKFMINVVKDIVQAHLNWKDTLMDIAGAIVKMFKGDFTGAFEDFKNVARKTFDDTISGFAEFGAESQRIMQELDGEVMEYAELWEQSNVDNKLAEISKQMEKTKNDADELANGAGGALKKMSKETEAEADKMIESLKKISDKFVDVGNKIKDLNKEIEGLLVDKGRKERGLATEAAEAIITQEEKIASIKKQIADESDFVKRAQLQKILAFEQGELERFSTAAMAFSDEIEEVRRRNSLSDIARTFEDLTHKRNAISQEFELKFNKIKEELEIEEQKFKDLVKLQKEFSKESLEILTKLTDDKIAEYNREIRKINELADAIREANTLSLSSGLISLALPSREHGGTVPGPVGTTVPILAHGQEQIIPANQTGRSGGGFSVTIVNPVFRNNEDERRMKGMLDKYFRPLVLNHKLNL